MTHEFEGLMIFPDDFRSCGYCTRGVREGFKRYNLSYADFVMHGIQANELLAACDNNAMVLEIVEIANERRRR